MSERIECKAQDLLTTHEHYLGGYGIMLKGGRAVYSDCTPTDRGKSVILSNAGEQRRYVPKDADVVLVQYIFGGYIGPEDW